MKVGEKYLARWNFNYDICDEMQGEIEITNVRENGNYEFVYNNRFGTTTWCSYRCRSIELIKKITDENFKQTL